jgi:hypothetical protein
MVKDNDAEPTDWWWIDYLENEMSPSLESDLLSLLQHSDEDRTTFEHFRLLREWLRGSDPVHHWPMEARIERMHNRVMQEILQGDCLPETDASVVAPDQTRGLLDSGA